MKLEIFNDTTPEPETVVTLRLQRDYEGGPIWLTAVNERGATIPQGHILRLTTYGSIKRCFGVNPAIGFDLDAQKRVEID